MGIHSLLPLVIFILGSVFSVIFGLMLYYALKAYYIANREVKLANLLHMTLESTADGILACNVHGQVTHFNQQFLPH